MFQKAFQKFDEERTRFSGLLSYLGELFLFALFFLSLFSLIFQYGTFINAKEALILSRVNFIIIILFCIITLVGLLISKKSLDFFMDNKWILFCIILIFANFVLLNGIFKLNITFLSKITLLILKLSVIVSRLYRIFLFLIQRLHVNPFVVMILSFVFVIIFGSFILMLPRAVVSGKSLNYIDALFISASATCVTGLSVIDIGKDLSLLGQLIVLSLIQIGGLGLMTLMCFFTIAFGTGFGLRERVMMRDILSIGVIGKISKIIVFILLLTISVEAFGSILYYFSFDFKENRDFLYRVYFSIFHAVSAFCNAGFSLNSNSLMDYKGNIPVNLTTSLLIVSGGLGFIVMYNIVSVFKRKILKSVMHIDDGYLPRFSVHTNLVFITTALLIIVGALLFYLFEGNYTLFDMGLKERIVVSFFQSITSRTAGFNTVEINNICNATLLLLVLLMFIGASPGGTGGGIKTSTFTVLLLSILSILKNRENVECFRRTIQKKSVDNAFLVIFLSLILVSLSSMIMLLTENIEFRRVLFEVVSAFGTVGLSTGITPFLTDAGKVILVLVMFIGRIGPISVVVAMSHHGVPQKYGYPESEVMIG